MKIPTWTIRLTKINHRAAGKIVRDARKRAGVSLRELARRMDISAPYLSDMELGKRNWDKVKFNAALEGLK
jgi:transcriptional regulator with XRE-family HTH domain